ncbi:hypothetical protein [Mycobacterium sp. IS-1264]|uniref:hypothetical protein n=1 Tax=Mycobacterium sp. IS-1264 TaxID=1834158 RepID=UPI00096ED2E3|nr:hypothetical protein [Mycobacterium sp. IS-1264]OMC39295.1 hypothetical protein A5744_22265 [Mycobacterium sp. IS-1264]
MKHPLNGHPLWMPRSRGAVSGLLLVVLGAWGALIPFVGPRFNFAYTPDQDWAWTSARGWLEVLPGGAAVLGGLLLIFSGNRMTAIVGGWLAAVAGAWFVIGGQIAPLLGIGSAGDPIAATDRKRAALEVSYFSGLGALIIFISGIALARLAVRLASDVEAFMEPAELAGPAEPASAPAGEPVYMSGLEEPAREVSSGAFTKPRTAEDGPKPKGWRRHRAGTEAGGANAYLRWPHPQS